MSESDGERAARSVALERAYVHEVYEECAERTARSKHWPRVCKFLEELEPGALVCDIGCGNGKYLGVNENAFTVGADRCERLTNVARRTNNEVTRCDNLALPFRDESFDAVLSIAVVHHFATTERRVNALKELARVLRIGGRLVISVWAMEQRHRKFESQDVLVPWPRAYRPDPRCEGRRDTLDSLEHYLGEYPDDDKEMGRAAANRRSVLSGKRGQGGYRGGYRNDQIFTPSPSSSSLSSPNESCYSFFRRALQKLAGGKRGSTGDRAWFLEGRHSGARHCHRRRGRRFHTLDDEDDDDDDEEDDDDDDDNDHDNNEYGDDICNVDDIPIELRRLEEDNATLIRETFHPSRGISDETLAGLKSKSLGDIPEIQRRDLVRSRSGIPGTSSPGVLDSRFTLLDEEPCNGTNESSECAINASSGGSSGARLSAITATVAPVASVVVSSTSFSSSSSSFTDKRKLVKQKAAHPSDEPSSEIPGVAALNSGDPVEQQQQQQETTRKMETAAAAKRRRRGNVRKQSSMNEELMSMERLVERDRVRKNIMKQASLNEEMMCKPSSGDGGDGETLRSRFSRDYLYSGNATTMQRFYLMKSGITDRIRQSTTSMENRVSAGIAIKNGFAKILESWKQSSAEERKRRQRLGESTLVEVERVKCNASSAAPTKTTTTTTTTTVAAPVAAAEVVGDENSLERRLSKEDGSDSSKDSSLQSDTSVDSEDSFASVIYVPKDQQRQPWNPFDRRGSCGARDDPHPSETSIAARMILPSAPDLDGNRPRTASAPPSPRGKHSPDPRRRCNNGTLFQDQLAPVSPLLKQFPATSKSLPPPSPPVLVSPRNTATEVYTFSPPKRVSPTSEEPTEKREEEEEEKETAKVIEKAKEEEKREEDEEEANSTSNESINERDIRLDRIKELLRQKPGFATRSVKTPFPLVRRASAAAGRSTEGASGVIEARSLPRLLSLELFNPETDDSDSESSGLSSPESVGSVISVISDQRFSNRSQNGVATAAEADATSTLPPRSISEEALDDFVVVSSNGELVGTSETELEGDPPEAPSAPTGGSGSVCSLGSLGNFEYDRVRELSHPERSASEETAESSGATALVDGGATTVAYNCGDSSGGSRSRIGDGDSSAGGGAITYHQYYHVFREGELDQLIEKYVENLHIISSYYDHASWCIVAEKVQVWTI